MTRCLICLAECTPRPVCELSATDVDERFSIVECPACYVMRTLPVPVDLRPYYETELARTVKRPSGALFGWLQRLLFRRELRRVNPGNPADSVLDVGCGSGAFALMLRRHGFSVIAADSGCERPACIAAEPTIPYYTVDFEHYEIDGLRPDSRYTVVLRHVLEHVKDPRACLARLQQHGAQRFYVVVPDSGSWERRLLGRYWYLWDPPRHLWHFNVAALRALCDSLKLEVVALGHDAVPNLVPSLYRWLRLRGVPAAVYERFGPRGTLSALAMPLNFLLPRNVVWLVAKATG